MTAALRVATMADIEAFERVPLDERLPARDVGTLLEQVAARHADRRAWEYVADPAKLASVGGETYAEFVATLRRAAALWRGLARIHALGERPVVAFLLPFAPVTHHVLWSAEVAGIAAPINPFLEVAHTAALLRKMGAGVLVVSRNDAALSAKLAAVLAEAPSVRVVVAVDDPHAGPTIALPPLNVPVLDWDKALASQEMAPRLDAFPIDPLSACAYVHTGGTTGTPKIAPQHHQGQVFENWYQALYFGIEPGSAVLAAMPLFHVAAMTLTGLTVLAGGGTLVLVGGGWRNRALFPVFWRLVERRKVRHVSLVPTVLGQLLDVPPDADTSSLRSIWCGAAPCPRSIIERFELTFGVPVIEGWGMTEVHCVATQNPPYGERRIGSVGLRFAYEDVRAVVHDADGHVVRVCAPGEAGVLEVRGPNVFRGYLGVPTERQPFDAEGWYDTGDLGHVDAQGYVWIVGRKKDLIIRGGHNIDPQQVEEVLATLPEVEMAAVVGRPDPYVGEMPVAYVKLRAGQVFDEAALLAKVRERTPERAAVPEWIEALDDLPTTALGKLAKNLLRALAAERVVRAACAEAGWPVRDVRAQDLGQGIDVHVVIDAPALCEPIQRHFAAWPMRCWAVRPSPAHGAH